MCTRLDCSAMRKFFSSPSCHLHARGFVCPRNSPHVQDRSIAFLKASRARVYMSKCIHFFWPAFYWLAWARARCLGRYFDIFPLHSRRPSLFLPKNTKLMLVKTLVFPYFDYAAGLLLDLTNERCTRLERCMNATLLLATGVKRWEHITPTYASHNLLK